MILQVWTFAGLKAPSPAPGAAVEAGGEDLNLVGPTVDGRNPAPAKLLRLVVYPVFDRFFSTIPGGWGWDFWSINSMGKANLYKSSLRVPYIDARSLAPVPCDGSGVSGLRDKGGCKLWIRLGEYLDRLCIFLRSQCLKHLNTIQCTRQMCFHDLHIDVSPN